MKNAKKKQKSKSLSAEMRKLRQLDVAIQKKIQEKETHIRVLRAQADTIQLSLAEEEAQTEKIWGKILALEEKVKAKIAKTNLTTIYSISTEDRHLFKKSLSFLLKEGNLVNEVEFIKVQALLTRLEKSE